MEAVRKGNMSPKSLSKFMTKVSKHVNADDQIKKITFTNGDPEDCTVIMVSKKYFRTYTLPPFRKRATIMKPCWQSSKVEFI